MSAIVEVPEVTDDELFEIISEYEVVFPMYVKIGESFQWTLESEKDLKELWRTVQSIAGQGNGRITFTSLESDDPS